MTDLEALRDAVVAGDDRLVLDVSRKITSDARDVSKHWEAHDMFRAYLGSVDAALAFVEAVLPGWAWEGGTLSGSATVYAPNYPGPDFEAPCYSAEADTPARALLIAALNALIAQDRREG